MELLKQHGLYGGGLVNIANPVLVGRYNDCLTGIGVSPTALTQFKVDGRGWSPQIAREKGSEDYLSHGAAQYAIILTPEQRDKPVYRPHYSFERAILGEVFRRGVDAIARITKTAGLWIEIDPGLSELAHPSDLTMFKSVMVRLSDTGGLIEASIEQKDLVSRFLNDRDAWLDRSLRNQLIASGQRFGDLRFTSSFKPTFTFGEMGCYYTSQFGGVFVLRGKDVTKELMVVMDEEVIPKDRVARTHGLRDRTLLARLIGLGLLEVPLEWYRQNLGILQELREGLLASAVFRSGSNGVDFSGLTDAQRKSYVVRHRAELPPEFSALERLEQRLQNGEHVDPQRLSLPLRWMLAKPTEGLPQSSTEVLWRLLCRSSPTLTVPWFYFDKDTFYKCYESWPPMQRAWAVNRILSSGLIPRRHV